MPDDAHVRGVSQSTQWAPFDVSYIFVTITNLIIPDRRILVQNAFVGNVFQQTTSVLSSMSAFFSTVTPARLKRFSAFPSLLRNDSFVSIRQVTREGISCPISQGRKPNPNGDASAFNSKTDAHRTFSTKSASLEISRLEELPVGNLSRDFFFFALDQLCGVKDAVAQSSAGTNLFDSIHESHARYLEIHLVSSGPKIPPTPVEMATRSGCPASG
ncbi:hypothetical protein C8F04DRAFT_1177125 [Mycena alexandri]|uniref:Uncharacterized protein n=1 Tax=Mycena alexandri TaxID=1745969 RepID=A0AAD6T945_9AGAR|nr:hypothetical protein C8F04DRAFT_1177125 [Mycena alexandri]